MASRREYEMGVCQNPQCGEAMKLKPPGRKFCKSRCRFAAFNRQRPRGTFDSAIITIDQHLMTVPDAVKVSGLSETSIRRMIKANRLRSKRMFGRVLVYRSQIEWVRSATSDGMASAVGKDMTIATAGHNVPFEVSERVLSSCRDCAMGRRESQIENAGHASESSRSGMMRAGVNAAL